MANDTLNELLRRALQALDAEHTRALENLVRVKNELVRVLEDTTDGLYELESSTLDMLARAHAVWIGEVTIPREPVRAVMRMVMEQGRVSVAIGPEDAIRELAPELKPGKFRVVCFAIRTGDAPAEGFRPRDLNP